MIKTWRMLLLLGAIALLGACNRAADPGPQGEVLDISPAGETGKTPESPTAAEANPVTAASNVPIVASAETASVPTLCDVIDPTLISLNTQGLPYSWQATCVGTTVYDASSGPMLEGIPTHVRVDLLPTAGVSLSSTPPALYAIPAEAYVQQWAETGNPVVGERMAALRELIDGGGPIPSSGLPVLPLERAAATNDVAVQAMPIAFAHSEGIRFVGHFGQGPNPLTNNDLYYVYQGFAGENDEVLVSFFYPISAIALPDSMADVAQEEVDLVNADPVAYLAERTAALNALSTQDFSPPLDVLDALVGSLAYGGQEVAEVSEIFIPPMARALPYSYGIITAPQGANIWRGPDPCYRGIGLAPVGTVLEIIGRSADGHWYVTPVVGAPNGQGWFRSSYSDAYNAEAAPIVAPPSRPAECAPPPTDPIPWSTPTLIPVYPTLQPYPDPIQPPPGWQLPSVSFWADRPELVQGECTALRWSAAYVTRVWLYEQGQAHQNFPVGTDGVRQVCPPSSTVYELRVQAFDGSPEVRQIPIQVLPGNTLADTAWTLTALYGQPPAFGTSPNIYFGSGSFVQGFSGCQSFTGNYSSGGGGILVNVTSESAGLCDDAAISQHIRYMEALRTATTYRMEQNLLVLYDINGQESLRFTR